MCDSELANDVKKKPAKRRGRPPPSKKRTKDELEISKSSESAASLAIEVEAPDEPSTCDDQDDIEDVTAVRKPKRRWKCRSVSVIWLYCFLQTWLMRNRYVNIYLYPYCIDQKYCLLSFVNVNQRV